MTGNVPNESDNRPRPDANKKLLWVLGLILLLMIGGGYLGGLLRPGHDHQAEEANGVKYTCPMHPQIISDRPGTCPICGMDLVKIDAAPAAQSPPAPAAKAKDELDDLFAAPEKAGPENKATTKQAILFYRNPMDPSVTSPTPAKDAMGMDYLPVFEDSVQSPLLSGGEKAGPAAASGAGIEDLATIRVGEEALKLTGIQTATASQETTRRTVRTVGIVVPDETLVRHIHTKVNGWIENLATNFTGQAVKEGTPLLSIYSPELLATQEEYLAAKRAAASMSQSTDPAAKTMGQELLQSARRRLELFDVPKSFIDRLEKDGAPLRAVTLEAPISGFVTAKGVYEGQEVAPGMELFTITDLSHVWIEAELYEYEAGTVTVGQEADLTLAYEPGEALKGKVAYVFPYLSPESRTLKVRFDFPNPELKLKPQMYADVTLALDQALGVTIPDSAVIDTGVRQVVFVEAAAGTFEPRQIRIGVRGEGKVQVVAGVDAGERVVVKANFLLDSESRLRAALDKVIGGSGK